MTRLKLGFSLGRNPALTHGRRPRKTPTTISTTEKFESSETLLKTVYPLTESEFRRFGIDHGLLPSYLSDPYSFKLDPERIYTSLENTDTNCLGRCARISVEELHKRLPEGLCGDAYKDIALLPHGSDFGLVNRKPALEIISQLQQYASQPTIQARGVLLDGKRGSGKSWILNHVALWARANGWLVVLEPSPSKYATMVSTIKRSNSGVYIQSEFARNFLQSLLAANESMLAEIPVQLQVYGKTSLDGTNVEYTRRMFDSMIDKVVAEELEIYKEEDPNVSTLDCEKEKLRLWHSYTSQFKIPVLSEKFQEPTTVLDIAQFGLANDAYANQAVYEIFQQLKVQTAFPLVIIIDEYNECFNASEYLSIKYDGTKYNGWIPSFHLSLPRLFSSFDGAQYKRGFKIVATSWQRTRRREYRPELLGILSNEIKCVRNFDAREFSCMLHHLSSQRVLFNLPSDKINYYYMMTGGNGFQSRRLLSMLY